MHKTPREPRAALYVRDCAAPPFDAQSRRDLLDELLRKTRIRSVTASQLLDRFGDLAGIFAATHPEADPPEGLGPAVRDLFQLVAALHKRHGHDLIDREREFLKSSQNTRNWLLGAALILFHNHPSGAPEPCDIRLLDHIVVGAPTRWSPWPNGG